MMLTMKETWAMSAAVFGQLIAWTLVSTIITNGIPFFETWTEPQSAYKLKALDILRMYQQPLWVGYVQFIALSAEILSVYLASEVRMDDDMWTRLEAQATRVHSRQGR